MRYIVISYDDDQQQTFFDVTEAGSSDKAKALAGELRDYAIPCTVLSKDDLEGFLQDLEIIVERDVLTRKNLKRLKKAYS
jgi:hypothetical protein